MANKTIRFKQDADLEIQGALRLQGNEVATKQYVDEHASKAATYEVEIPVPTWMGNSTTGFYQKIETSDVLGITAEDDPIVDVILGDNISANKEALTAYECLTRITTSKDAITVYADYNKPNTTFSIKLKVV